LEHSLLEKVTIHPELHSLFWDNSIKLDRSRFCPDVPERSLLMPVERRLRDRINSDASWVLPEDTNKPEVPSWA
jgi:hypothetical protein